MKHGNGHGSMGGKCGPVANGPKKAKGKGRKVKSGKKRGK